MIQKPAQLAADSLESSQFNFGLSQFGYENLCAPPRKDTNSCNSFFFFKIGWVLAAKSSHYKEIVNVNMKTNSDRNVLLYAFIFRGGFLKSHF